MGKPGRQCFKNVLLTVTLRVAIPYIEQPFSAALSKTQPGDRYNWQNGFQVQGEPYNLQRQFVGTSRKEHNVSNT